MARASAKRSSRRSSSRALETDPIKMLTADHKAVELLFRQFKKLHDAGEDTSAVIQFVREALTIHSTLEKEIFYPAVRKLAGEEEEELLDEAEVEHLSVEQLIRTLGSRKLSEKKREANFTVLMEYVRHHVKEEEKEMFPKVKRLRRINLKAVGAQMETRKAALLKKAMR
jgi:hemerythrin superfamily protein